MWLSSIFKRKNKSTEQHYTALEVYNTVFNILSVKNHWIQNVEEHFLYTKLVMYMVLVMYYKKYNKMLFNEEMYISGWSIDIATINSTNIVNNHGNRGCTLIIPSLEERLLDSSVQTTYPHIKDSDNNYEFIKEVCLNASEFFTNELINMVYGNYSPLRVYFKDENSYVMGEQVLVNEKYIKENEL